jgi:hypothetical protein
MRYADRQKIACTQPDRITRVFAAERVVVFMTKPSRHIK